MAIEKKYKLYAFDFDGTLVDTKVDVARGFQALMVEMGREKPSIEKVLKIIGGGANEAVMRLTGLGESEAAPYTDRFLELYSDICSDNTVLYEGAEALLARLKSEGAVLAVVTMKAKNHTHMIIEKHGLTMFDEVIAFDDFIKPKPDAQSMNDLLKKYNIDKCDALMFGDTVTDMGFAKNAGIDACAMTHGYGENEDILAYHPAYVLSSFLDV